MRVEGGAHWGDVDHATHAFGLAVAERHHLDARASAGSRSAAASATSSRRYGLSIDNLLAVDMVLADGSIVTASEDEHPDLFWAVRGGGGNFGVVTSFLFRGHPVDTVVAGPMFWPLERPPRSCAGTTSSSRARRRTLNGFFAFLTVPPGAAVPAGAAPAEDVRRRLVLHRRPRAGRRSARAGARARAAGARRRRPMPFPALQSAFDALYPPGLQWYWKADFVDELSDEAIAAHVEHGAQAADACTRRCTCIRSTARSTTSARDDTAFGVPRRRATREVIVGVDPDPAQRAPRSRDWARDYYDAMHPYSAGGAYVNFLMETRAPSACARPTAQLRPAGRGQAPLRPREPVPGQPEHRPVDAAPPEAVVRGRPRLRRPRPLALPVAPTNGLAGWGGGFWPAASARPGLERSNGWVGREQPSIT